MAVEKKTVTIIGIAFAVLLLLMGLARFGLPTGEYIASVIALATFIIVISEIGLKKATNLSKLKKFSIQQYMTLTSGIVVLITGILSLPFIMIDWAILSTVAGFAMIITSIFVLVEVLTR